MKTLLRLCLFLVAVACIGQAQTAGMKKCDSNPQTISASNLSITIPNDCRGMTGSVDYVFAGSPASSSLVMKGCPQSGVNCSTLETYTGNASSLRKPTIDTVYSYFTITATLTGGTSPTVVVTPLITTSRGNSSAGSTVTSFNTRTGDVLPATNDYSFSQLASLPTTLAGFGITDGVPSSRTVAGHALSADVTVSASDLTTGTLPHAQLPSLVSGDIPSNASNTSGTASNLSGTPALPNGVTGTSQAVDDNTTKLATDAFVLAQAASATPLIDGTAAVGTSNRYARGDHVHPTDTTRVPTTRQVAGHALSADVTLAEADVTSLTTDLAAKAVTIASGTSAMGTSAISSATCATVVTTSATGTATTDNIMADFNADPTGVTGYQASSTGMLTIIKYPTTNNVNFKVCNNTASSITPGAITLNWRVVR